MHTRLKSQWSPSVPVSLDAWSEFYASYDSIIETPPSLRIPDLRQPQLGCYSPLRQLRRKDF